MAREVVCTRFGFVGKAATKTPGSILLELVAWLCFLVPGLLYSLWRHAARHPVCRSCGARELVPPDSPLGRQLLARTPSG